MPTSKTQNSIRQLADKTQNVIFKTILFIFLFVALRFTLYALPSSEAHAQDTASCDFCGWCGINADTKPADWERCMRCVFPTGAQRMSIPTPPGRSITKPIATPGPFYPSNPEVSKNWTVVGCLDTAPGGFAGQVYKIILSIGSGLAFLAFVYGGFTVLTAGGDPQKVAGGKNIIMGAIFGLLLILFSVFLLRLIGFQIIKIPGFGSS